MAVNSATLDAAKYIDVYTKTAKGGLKRLPFAFVEIDGQNYIEVGRVGGPGYDAPDAIPRNVISEMVMDHVPFPIATAQPASDTNTVAGEVAVHFFGGV